MSEIKDRQDAASDIDPIVAALADDASATAAVEGVAEAIDQVDLPADSDAAATGILSASEGTVADAVEATPDIEPAEREELAADAVVATVAQHAVGAEGEAETLDPADAVLGDEAAPAALVAVTDEAPYDEAAAAADWSDAALLESVADAIAPAPFDHATAAHSDTVVELEDQIYGSDADDSGDDGPLLDGDLEHGIASVFAALHAAAQDREVTEPLGDLEAADGVTFRLLGELDRLWHRAA